MKIIDRYVAWTFLKNWLISFMVLVGLYVVLDMIFHFDEMAQVGDSGGGGGVVTLFSVLANVADFYFYQVFAIFVQLSGIIPVVAAAFTLLRLSRFNELTALMAAGMPLLRVAMPVIVVGLLLNVLLIVDQELILPRMVYQLTRDHDEVHQVKHQSMPIPAMQDASRALLSAARYTAPVAGKPARMEMLDVIERDEAWRPVAHITADAATWDARRNSWRLENGWRTEGLAIDAHPRTSAVAVLNTSITPEEIALYRSSDVVEFLSTRRINQLLERPESYGRNHLLRVKHWRFTQPIANTVLLLLAISAVLGREPGRLKLAAGKCVALTGACLGAMFLAQLLAGHTTGSAIQSDVWPALLAWLPLLIFAPLAVLLLDRVKT